MKNYDETVRSVFDRIHAYEAEKKRQKTVFLRVAVAGCSLCLAAIIGFGILLYRDPGLPHPDVEAENGSDFQNTDSLTVNSGRGEIFTPPFGWDDVIWSEGPTDGVQDAGYAQWNGKQITMSLYDVLKTEGNQTRYVAIGVGFELDMDFVYQGRTLMEHCEDFTGDNLPDRMGELLKVGDELKYGDALWQTGDPSGKKWSKFWYDETVKRIGADLLSIYIVNGEFLKDKLEADIAAYDKGESLAELYYAACEACLRSAAENAKAQLEKKNVTCEIRNGGLVLFVTPSQFAEISLDGVAFYSLAHKETNGDDLETYTLGA